MLLQQLIHFQLRFLQTEHMYNHYLLEGKHDAPDCAYLTVLRELDRILKTIKAFKALIAERGATKEIEPIEDPPAVPTPDEYAKTRNKAIRPSGPEITQSITEYIYTEFCKAMDLPPVALEQKSQNKHENQGSNPNNAL